MNWHFCDKIIYDHGRHHTHDQITLIIRNDYNIDSDNVLQLYYTVSPYNRIINNEKSNKHRIISNGLLKQDQYHTTSSDVESLHPNNPSQNEQTCIKISNQTIKENYDRLATVK